MLPSCQPPPEVAPWTLAKVLVLANQTTRMQGCHPLSLEHVPPPNSTPAASAPTPVLPGSPCLVRQRWWSYLHHAVVGKTSKMPREAHSTQQAIYQW